MSYTTEQQIRDLCSALCVASNDRETERIADALRAAVAAHLKSAKNSLEIQARVIRKRVRDDQ